jgi:hypothetical protein
MKIPPRVIRRSAIWHPIEQTFCHPLDTKALLILAAVASIWNSSHRKTVISSRTQTRLREQMIAERF